MRCFPAAASSTLVRRLPRTLPVMLLTLLTGLFMPASWAAAQTQVASQSEGASLLLNGQWRFVLAKTEQDAAQLADFYRAEFDAKDFKPTPVPSNWAVLGYEEPVYRGFKDDKASEGFYLHDFAVPADWKGRRVLLHFGGVWSSAEVWLNGKLLGRHDSGYTSFAFEVSGELKPGETNRFAVRVRQVTREYKFDTYDDWTLGGIYRDVSLEAMPGKRWVDRLVVQTDFDDLYRDADLNLRVMISDRQKSTLPGNYASPGEPYELRVVLRAKDGAEVARRELTIPSHIATDRETRLAIKVNDVRHWTAETPYLYDLSVELLEKGKVTHARHERVGFREISTTGGVFRINGQAVKLRGVNRHDEHPDVGRATTREHWIEDLTLMKAANINFIRLAHYTPAKGFIELCDELGMYVGNEVSMGGAGDLMYDPSFNGAVLQRAYETVTRDINHASIIYWSVGNEDPLTSLHMAAVHAVKGLDATRPVLLPWRFEEWLPPEIDILAPHYWKPQEYDQLAGKSSRPIITTEYTHAYGTEGFGGLEARWKALTKHPAGAGGAVWLWADQGMKSPTPKPGGGVNDELRITEEAWDGIVDSYRKPTRDYWEAKAVYAQVYPAIEKLNFLPGQISARVPIQNDYDFTDLKTVTIEWAIREDERELAKGSGVIEGSPHAAAPLELPLAALRTVRADRTYYAWFIFKDAGGNEITRKTVELVPQSETAQVRSVAALTVNEGEAGVVAIQAGDVRYVFNRETGHLSSVDAKGRDLIKDLRPVIWRKLDASELIALGKVGRSQMVDLDKYTSSVSAWAVEKTGDTVILRATVSYAIKAENSFTAKYEYVVGADGCLTVSYEILPKVKAPWLPVVGMSVQAAPELTEVRWLGLGPYDAYPNKRSAPILGVWNRESGDGADTGIKATRWIERRGAAAGGFRIWNEGYFEYDAAHADRLRILSGVFGRPEKSRKADESIPQMRTDTGEPFLGKFRIELRAE